MVKFKPHELVKNLKVDSFRVHAPSSIIFLCGGVIGDQALPPKMLRDAFYRLSPAFEADFKIILAEQAVPLTSDAGYKDLFSFESDIAQLVSLILLFAESPGSLAELGAFAALETVAPSLLAVIDEYYYEQSSFIRNGPIKFLENNYGEEWIHVLDRKDINIGEDGSIEKIDTKRFFASVQPAIDKRMKARAVWQKFDKSNTGHIILLMVGLCQEFGALTVTEIRDVLKELNLLEQRIANYIYCSELLGWIKRVRKGNHIFYVALPGKPALDYQFSDISNVKDKLRFRSDIRDYWRETDGPRLRAITESISAAAAKP